MSESPTGLFHCGRCGHFFKARTGPGVIRRCPECGGDPSLAIDDRRVRKMANEKAIVRGLAPNPEAAEPQEAGQAQHEKHQAHRKRRKSNRAMQKLVVFVGAWLVILGVFATSVLLRNKRREREEARRVEDYKASHPDESTPFSRDLSPADREFIRQAWPECREALFGVLQNVSPETRSHWVCDPLETIRKMTRFGGAVFSCKPDEMPEPEYFGILATPEGRMIESLWKTPDNKRIEAVFEHTKDGWRLDWEDFVRYSETQWPMFLVGSGSTTEEFRLLARQRLAEERKHSPAISVLFYSPRFGKPDRTGPASPVFEVLRSSVPGRKLEALFKLKEAGKAPFDARAPSLDPSGMIRVRVRIRRIDPEKGKNRIRKFVIEDVLAGHWLRIDDSGIPSDDEDSLPADEDPGERRNGEKDAGSGN